MKVKKLAKKLDKIEKVRIYFSDGWDTIDAKELLRKYGGKRVRSVSAGYYPEISAVPIIVIHAE